MTATEIAWLSGIYEGEGCINKDRRKPSTWRISLVMTDFDVIDKLQKLTGVGSVRTRTKQKDHHKTAYQWIVGRKAQVQYLLSLMLPYLGNRRAHDALNALDTIELL